MHENKKDFYIVNFSRTDKQQTQQWPSIHINYMFCNITDCAAIKQLISTNVMNRLLCTMIKQPRAPQRLQNNTLCWSALCFKHLHINNIPCLGVDL